MVEMDDNHVPAWGWAIEGEWRDVRGIGYGQA